MTKQELARQRNYFKYVISGMHRSFDLNILTDKERERWLLLQNTLTLLERGFDESSRKMGLSVPEHRCWCNKPAKYELEGNWYCKKHLNNKND